MKNSEYIEKLINDGYTIYSTLSTREGTVEFTNTPDVYIRTNKGLIVYTVDIKGVTVSTDNKKKTATVK